MQNQKSLLNEVFASFNKNKMIKSIEVRKSFSRFLATQCFVPRHDPVLTEDVEKLKNFLIERPNVLVLTGAGISTESGINNV